MASKGFVFALDAMLSVMVLAASLAGLYFLSSHVEQDVSEELVLKKQCGDALAVLDRQGDLSSRDPSRMNATLAFLFSDAVSYNLTVDYYNYSGGFSQNGSAEAAYGSLFGSRLIVSSELTFASKENGSWQYGKARLRVWQ